ncbi:hypothetical protein AB4114_22165 [Paenibacillus sp. 2RAB27]|uniref:hypothetical protein n=1 Tax=Paenibacillus sp. 2RAB27 TaxID=3232991 RepID=UPI003F991908
MWPLGEYDRLVHEVKRREDADIPITFGLLIADYRQQLSREYILNYIDRFNYKSDRYINFYLPGYFEENLYGSAQVIKISGKQYYFNDEKYMEFLLKLEMDFEIEYIYNPTLILMEYDRGRFNKAKIILIELDHNGADIKKTGELFENIFKLAKQHVDINELSNEMMRKEFKRGLFDRVLRVLDNKLVTEIYDACGRVKNFKLS